MKHLISTDIASKVRKNAMIQKLEQFHRLAKQLEDLNHQPINLDHIIEEYGCNLTIVTEQLIQDFDRIPAEDF